MGWGKSRIVYGLVSYRLVSTVALMLLLTEAEAQSQKLSNVDLCNGRDRSSPQPQIIGCTALIRSDVNNPKVLSIAHNNRGNAYASRGQYGLAIQDYNKSIELNPNYAKPYNNRGVAYQKSGEYDAAIKDFDAAINLDPNYANAFANRGEAYQKEGDYLRALKDFDEAIRLQPALSAVVWNERCWTRAIIDELQGALADCNEAIRLEPNVAATFDSRGLTYLKLGRWELAIADFNVALRLNAKLPSALYGRGLAKLKSGNPVGGHADIAAAESIDHNIVKVFSHYGLN